MSDDIKNPKFNSSIQYLDRISALISTKQQAVIDKDWDKVYLLTMEVFAEVEPRFTADQLKTCEDLGKQCYNMWKLYNGGNHRFNVSIFISKLNMWFRRINLYSHQQGLIMEDKPDMQVFDNI